MNRSQKLLTGLALIALALLAFNAPWCFEMRVESSVLNGTIARAPGWATFETRSSVQFATGQFFAEFAMIVAAWGLILLLCADVKQHHLKPISADKPETAAN